MDPHKKATRPATDYMGRGSNPADVPVARDQRLADQFYRSPGTRVPNNTMIGQGVAQGVAQENGQVYSNPYQDWRGSGLPGTGINYEMKRPAPPQARMMSPQPMMAGEQLGDLEWAGRVNGSGGPLAGAPNEWVTNPGIAKQSPRYSTGQPGAPPVPAGMMPMRMEDLQSAQTPLNPVAPDLMMSASRTEGSPADATLPRPGRGAAPTSKGAPSTMPSRRN
jgi:hypothetical protein